MEVLSFKNLLYHNKSQMNGGDEQWDTLRLLQTSKPNIFFFFLHLILWIIFHHSSSFYCSCFSLTHLLHSCIYLLESFFIFFLFFHISFNKIKNEFKIYSRFVYLFIYLFIFFMLFIIIFVNKFLILSRAINIILLCIFRLLEVYYWIKWIINQIEW